MSPVEECIAGYARCVKEHVCRKGEKEYERRKLRVKRRKRCPYCGREYFEYQNPIPTVDVIIEIENQGIVLIKRKHYPHGWALPGGFVDYGETLERAAVREAQEETSLTVELLRQFHVYSDPRRDPRHHTITVVFIARAEGIPHAADDAEDVGIFTRESLPHSIAFDHADILNDYFRQCNGL
ncbi:MAG: NUDIX hydrolase [Deltaproteobacteria bacterium]|nr:NUDIX hydrolase [Deltaproteobacteria bacterium]